MPLGRHLLKHQSLMGSRPQQNHGGGGGRETSVSAIKEVAFVREGFLPRLWLWMCQMSGFSPKAI